jgi:hypothetical protein
MGSGNIPKESNTVTVPVKSDRLPPRDYIILPLLSLCTVVLMLGVSEIAARVIWPVRDFDACLVYNPAVGGRFRPNCTSITKNAESGWVVNKYNDCGYRSAAPCGVRPHGVLRVVVLGSSFTEGDFVPYSETFAAQASKKLTAICGHSVEFQNLGVQGATPLDVSRRVDEVIRLRPDAVIYPIAPYDLESMPASHQDRAPVTPAPVGYTALLKTMYVRVGQTIRESRTVFVAQHYIFENPSLYVKLFLVYGDKADFLRQPFTPAWQNRFHVFDTLVGNMSSSFRAAHIPFVITAAPSRSLVSMLDDNLLPAHVDPNAFARAIAHIAVENSIQYIDLMGSFTRIQNASSLFFPVDGHLKGDGQAVVSDAIVRKLLQHTFPGMQTCTVKGER